MGSDARHTAAAFIFGLNGKPLTLRDLPPSRAAHWTPRRKAEVVQAVRTGLLSLEQAGARYALSREEFSSWLNQFSNFELSEPARVAQVKSQKQVAAVPHH